MFLFLSLQFSCHIKQLEFFVTLVVLGFCLVVYFVSNEVVLLLFLVLLIYFLKTDNLFHSNRFVMKRHA